MSLGRPSLTHQRPQEEKQRQFSTISEWYKKGVKEGPKATKFRDGACENCGSMTHKKKDCLEVRRERGREGVYVSHVLCLTPPLSAVFLTETTQDWSQVHGEGYRPR